MLTSENCALAAVGINNSREHPKMIADMVFCLIECMLERDIET